MDRAGTPVVLRGVNMSGTEYACAQNHTDDPFAGQPEEDPATLAAIRSWHANVVRLPLNEDCWLGINGVRVGGAPYRAAVTGLARALEGSGFYVILDLHWSAPGGQRALSQNPAPDQDHSPAFWSSVAQTFRGDDDVLFDLFNEPYFRWEAPGGPGLWTCLWQGCTLSRYLTGGSPTTIRASWRTAGMDQLISAVRRAGARNVILVAGLDWANDLSGWLQHRSHDRNLAASWHSYPNNHCSSQSCWDRAVAPLARRVPVVVTEVGDSASRPAAYLPNLLPWCDRHHLGYLAWTWNAWPQPRNVLVTNMRTGAPTAGEGAY
ncbi:MAG: glycoside hydrolase family 5 protein, partial [Candidatus Dormibacteria bacterium]